MSNNRVGQGRFSSAILWALAARQMDRVLGIVSISVLARLLTPQEFGLVSMGSAVVAMVGVLTSFGFDWALIRIKAPVREHYDTAWTLRLMSGVATFVLLAAVAPGAAAFYRRPEVTSIILLLGLAAVVNSAENIGMVDYRREMRFDAEFKSRMVGRLSGVCCAFGVAYVFRTYWALVAGTLTNSVMSVLATYWMSKYRPRFCFSRRKEFLSFSVWMLLGAGVDRLRARFAEIYIGREFGSGSVGMYTLAGEISSVAVSEIAAPINRVSFNKYTDDAHSGNSLRERFLQVSGMIWAIGLPAAVGIEMCAREIVETLLGSQWVGVVGVLQILAVAGIISLMEANTHYVYWALGKAQFVTRLAILAAICFMGTTIVSGGWGGSLGVATAQVIAGSIVLVVNYGTLMRTLALPLRDILLRQWRVAAGCAFMAAALWGEQAALAERTAVLFRLVLLICSGAAVYIGAVFVLWLASGRPPGSEEQLYVKIRELVSRRVEG